MERTVVSPITIKLYEMSFLCKLAFNLIRNSRMDSNLKINQIGKPHFLCIGAPKTATTWLNYCLSQHSQIYIPPRKELNYFSKYRFTTKQFLQSCYRTIPNFVIKTIKGTRIESPHQTFLALRWQLPPQSPLFVLIHMLAFPYKVYRLMNTEGN